MIDAGLHKRENGVPSRPGFSGVLQRKCACGGSARLTADCDECGQQKLSLQRSANTSATPGHNAASAPPIVHQVLNSGGRPLNQGIRQFMEPRFGHDFRHAGTLHALQAGTSQLQVGPADDHYEREADTAAQTVMRADASETARGFDFSQVRIHTDERAAESARAVDALAYTVGRDVVFGAGQFRPETSEGRQLIAHELAHVVQQNGAGAGLQRKPDEAGPTLPYCPSVDVLEGKLDFSDPKTRRSYTEANCLTSASQSMPPACRFTPAQTKALEEAQKTAGGRAERALGIINMSAAGKKMAAEMAGQLFESDPPSLAEVVERVTKVRDFLKTAKIDFAGRTCGEPACQGGAVAYVTGPGTLPIYLCPTAFSMPSSLHRTVLHEALHWTGLDADPTTPEGYCSKFDCTTPCLDKEVADAWSHYLDCLGKPFTIRTDFRDKIIDSVKDLP